MVDGFKAGACGESCTFDAAAAKAAYEAAGGYQGTLTMTLNADAPTQGRGRRRSATRSRTPSARVRRQVPTVTSRPSRIRSTQRSSRACSAAGWQMDYPSIENFLAPIYAKGAAQAPTGSSYSNPKFDAKLNAKAAAATSPDEANSCTRRQRPCWRGLPGRPAVELRGHSGLVRQGHRREGHSFGVLDFVAVKVK